METKKRQDWSCLKLLKKGCVMAKHWTKEEVVRLFELLVEKGSDLTSHPEFRKHLDRDGNLFANQVTREANGNIAYRSVDFDVSDGMSDKDFWGRIDATPSETSK